MELDAIAQLEDVDLVALDIPAFREVWFKSDVLAVVSNLEKTVMDIVDDLYGRQEASEVGVQRINDFNGRNFDVTALLCTHKRRCASGCSC